MRLQFADSVYKFRQSDCAVEVVIMVKYHIVAVHFTTLGFPRFAKTEFLLTV